MRSWRPSAAYRIAFSALGGVLLGLAALGVVVFVAMHIAFTRQLDATIRDESRTLVDEFHADGDRELGESIAEREASRSPQRLMYAVFAANGRRVYGHLQTSRPQLGLHDIQFTDPAEGQDAARGLVVDLSPNERLLVAADREWIERIDQTNLELFGAAFVAACLLGFAGAVALARYLQRRLRGISSSAEAIIGGDIRKRMPVTRQGDEFDQLATTLNRMLDRIEGLVENLRQVSSDVAHDLRTPLSRLRNRLETGASAATKQQATGVIRDAISRVDEVLTLFAAILRISEVESGESRRRFAMVDLTALVLELAESYAPAIQDGGRAFFWSVDPGVMIVGDRELIAQAAVNLLENAQRHTPPQTIIRLTLTTVSNAACLRVADNGPGVARSDLGRITKRFARLERSRNTPGHGLGLNLASAIARLHDGHLRLQSRAGFTATLELPVKRLAEPAGQDLIQELG